MVNERDEVHAETDAVRGGSTPHVVRWVLGISIVAAIVLLSAVWIFGAASQGDVEEEATATAIEQSQEGSDDTDGVVIDQADELDSEAADVPMDTEANVTEEETDLGADAETGQ